jgi:hypothetical protein
VQPLVLVLVVVQPLMLELAWVLERRPLRKLPSSPEMPEVTGPGAVAPGHMPYRCWLSLSPWPSQTVRPSSTW